MGKEYTYNIGKYTIGVDTNGEDGIGLTVAIIENDKINFLGSCYGENARCIDLLIRENQELKKQLEEKNLVDLGFCDNEPVGFKYDKNINKPVLACRCDNYYYAYPTKTGWVFYRSRYLGERDKEIVDIPFIDWAYAVLKEVE